jgi:hypothetical protein
MESISHYTPFLLLLLAAGDIVCTVEEQRKGDSSSVGIKMLPCCGSDSSSVGIKMLPCCGSVGSKGSKTVAVLVKMLMWWQCWFGAW